MTPNEKVAALRQLMQQRDISAFIVYSADPHMSEYLPTEWQERQWLSGFTGSAGFVVVTQKNAGLWTDGRYFTQANTELKDSGIDLFKDRIEGTINYIDWIISETQPGAKIAVNALATAHANWNDLNLKLTKAQRQIIDSPLLNELWTERGEPVKNEVFTQPISRSGQNTIDKLSAIRQKLAKKGATAHIISSLDDVAWTLNLRGSDVECNPVFLGYIYMTTDRAILFVDEDKLTDDAKKQLAEAQVELSAYANFLPFLKQLKDQCILLSPQSNQAIFEAVKSTNQLIEGSVPGNLMKAIKNDTELKGTREAMLRDGVAMVKFIHWLTKTAGKEELNEYGIGEKLRNFRAEGRNFVGESFGSIVGFKGNGAIIHYSAKPETAAQVTNDSSILVDSGGQYIEGTTDITRTFPLGKVSDSFKHDYTIVLKGMIQLSMAQFPKGTRGSQLDVLARLPLWREGKDFNHGTGHGVGSFLNVHEGPQSIRKEENAIVLQPGMILSNEPGYYIENQYGIRHENLMVVKADKTTEWNNFYAFETLTLCPFMTEPIIKDLLSSEEIDWLNTYHQTCAEKLGDLLEGEVKSWFLEQVKPI